MWASVVGKTIAVVLVLQGSDEPHWFGLLTFRLVLRLLPSSHTRHKGETRAVRCPHGVGDAVTEVCKPQGSPPSAGITYNCAGCFGTRSETKASRAPSGDQRGAVSRLGPVVKRRGSPPVVSTTQMLERYSSWSSESLVTTKATRRPSGESWGSLLNRICVISCGVMARRLCTVIVPLTMSALPPWRGCRASQGLCRPYSLMCDACHPSMLARQCQTHST